MKALCIAVSIVFIALIASCSESSTGPSSANELFPLKIGNKWTYNYTAEGAQSTRVNEVAKDTTIDGNKWFIVTLDSKPVFISRNSSNGMLFWQGGKSVLFYKHPANVNDIYNADTVAVKVIAKDIEVTTPAGTFKCYRYKTIYGANEEYDEFFSVGTGVVKIIGYRDSSGVKVVSEQTELVSKIIN